LHARIANHCCDPGTCRRRWHSDAYTDGNSYRDGHRYRDPNGYGYSDCYVDPEA